MSKIRWGREREAQLIHQANRAAAVGQLMLGELSTWHQFLEADTMDLTALPRRNLKAALTDVRRRLSREIKRFCVQNFHEMDEQKLSLLYEEIKAHRGLELPLSEFERRFAPIRRDVLQGNPSHATVCISLWGLQFKFPEHELAKDLLAALRLVAKAQTELQAYETKSQSRLRTEKNEIASLTREKMFAVRSAVLCCFNLMEAYLNGLAWDYMQTHDTERLSNRKRKLLEDTTSASIRTKLQKYPEIITGKRLWKQPDRDLEGLIGTLKPYRDSLVHPSPFSAPERFGGYDKLRLFYRVDSDTAIATAQLLIQLIRRIHEHVHNAESALPVWIGELEAELANISEQIQD